MAQLKCVWPYISLWWPDLKPLACSRCPWAGRESPSAQPRPLHPFTNTEGPTLAASLSRVPWKVSTFESFDCLELRVSSEVPCRATSSLTHVYFHIPSKSHPLDTNPTSVRFKIVHFLKLQPKDVLLASTKRPYLLGLWCTDCYSNRLQKKMQHWKPFLLSMMCFPFP